MFRPIESNDSPTITFTFDNQPVTAAEGMTIAAALFAAGLVVADSSCQQFFQGSEIFV